MSLNIHPLDLQYIKAAPYPSNVTQDGQMLLVLLQRASKISPKAFSGHFQRELKLFNERMLAHCSTTDIDLCQNLLCITALTLYEQKVPQSLLNHFISNIHHCQSRPCLLFMAATYQKQSIAIPYTIKKAISKQLDQVPESHPRPFSPHRWRRFNQLIAWLISTLILLNIFQVLHTLTYFNHLLP